MIAGQGRLQVGVDVGLGLGGEAVGDLGRKRFRSDKTVVELAVGS